MLFYEKGINKDDKNKYERYQKYALNHVLEQSISVNEKMGKHISIILEGNKTISVGYSNSNRNTFCGMKVSSLHSEMDAVSSLIKNDERDLIRSQCDLISTFKNDKKVSVSLEDFKKRNNKWERSWKKRVMVVIRIHYNDDGSITLMESKPCLHCATILYTLGFTEVYHSNNEGNIIKTKLTENVFYPSSGIYLI